MVVTVPQEIIANNKKRTLAALASLAKAGHLDEEDVMNLVQLIVPYREECGFKVVFSGGEDGEERDSGEDRVEEGDGEIGRPIG